ncbi:MAG: MBL fold metallo-hydrolase [Cytophagales bacterium]|nr:MBL fold metallo-hydrolase [Cytophagales bacterium]
MKLQFLGAAKQVTGSMYLLELEDGYKILIDCGTDMEREIDFETPIVNKSFFPFDASLINLVVLTHAHIDHSGNIPMLFREGYEGQVLCTPPTADLTELLLFDSANLHLRRLKAAQGESNKKHKQMDRLLRKGDMYLQKDVENSLENFVTLQFNKKFTIKPGLEITFFPAGHLLGAAHLYFSITEGAEIKTLGFSGDIGRNNYPLHIDPQILPPVDYLICESTYGNRIHEDKVSPMDAMEAIIKETCIDKPGRLVIPAFSVGRTQAVLFTLNRLIEERNFPAIRVFTDSPMGRSSTKIYAKYLSYLNSEARSFQKEYDELFDFDNLVYLQSEKESNAIQNYHEPCVIISSSGMITGGRVEKHIADNISNSYATILLIGYSAEGTLGRQLLAGSETIKVKDREYKVNARIRKIDVFSGHADQLGLLSFIKNQQIDKLKKVFLTHGEEESMLEFSQEIQKIGFKEVILPAKNETYLL